MAVYKGRTGLTDVEAQVIGEEFEQLGTKFTPHDVLKLARSERSRLHRYFEWDDTKAAETYRVAQARALIEKVKIVISIAGNKTETRAFHSVMVRVEEEETLQPRYVPLRSIRQSANLKNQVINQALKELNGWRTRYEQYREVLGIGLFEEIDSVIDKHADKIGPS